jgi:hypothetical protein
MLLFVKQILHLRVRIISCSGSDNIVSRYDGASGTLGVESGSLDWTAPSAEVFAIRRKVR